MQQPLPTPLRPGARSFTTPRFYLTERKLPPLGAILLAMVVAAGALSFIIYAVAHTGHARFHLGNSGSARSGTPTSPSDDDDDPNQIDTIVLGDPADAPVPGKRGNHVSPVHPTIVVRLPRFGPQSGMIPATPAGHLLYDWLAAFNQSSPGALRSALPSLDSDATVAAQMALRKQTGGFALLSSKEVQPGILVFRMVDQTPAATEVLGTLYLRPDSYPPAIASFSLRAVEPHKDPASESASGSAASPQ